MKNLKLFLSLIAAAVLFMTGVIFAQNEMQGVKVTDAGTFNGNLNGKEFKTMIRYSEAKDLVAVATGDEGFTLTINYEGISSISQMKPGTYDLPESKSVKVIFLNNTLGMPSVVTSGKFIVTENDGKVVKGTLEFKASAGGIPKEMGGAETKLSGGSFVITKKQ
ncbi:MAG: hypothetical protein OQK65_01765 [Chlorobium sp.]|nr:hypothetical protein [Chlorobium sp.]